MPVKPGAPPTGAFTRTAKGLVRDIVVDIHLSQPFPAGQPPATEPKLVPAKALWDTGASNSSITKQKADEIGLVPIGKVEVHHAGGKSLQNVYLLNIYLPNRFSIATVRVTECSSVAGGFDFIVGMEIIILGDFAITNVGGKTTVTFRMPSTKTIDFVQDIRLAENADHVGRNQICPCGSGKKYKFCHGM